eukprot:1712897-Pyramimonas_sp.AAC.1
MSNAFPSTSHVALQVTVMDVIPHPQDRALLHQRHTEAVVEIRAGEQFLEAYRVVERSALPRCDSVSR